VSERKPALVAVPAVAGVLAGCGGQLNPGADQGLRDRHRPRRRGQQGIRRGHIKVVKEVAANFDRQQAVRAVRHEKVRKAINTANPLVTQKNARSSFKRVERKLSG
jgi:hypothetical protein